MEALLVAGDRVARAAGRQIDRARAPLVNARLRRRAETDPAGLDARVERAIDRAVDWFAALPGLEFPSFVLLKPALDAGMEPRLAFVDHWLSAYAARFNNPELRLFDPAYDAEDPAHSGKPRVGANHPINEVMLRCVTADRDGGIEALLRDLRALEDGGMYGTTHIVWGALVLRRFRAAPESEIEALIEAALPSLLARQRRDRFCDHFAERMLFLQWIGRSDLVDPAWILRTVDAQEAAGGWRRHCSWLPMFANQHTTALALAGLVIFRARRRDGWRGRFWDPPDRAPGASGTPGVRPPDAGPS